MNDVEIMNDEDLLDDVQTMADLHSKYHGRELIEVFTEDGPDDAEETIHGLYWTLDGLSKKDHQRLKQVLYKAQDGDYFLVYPGPGIEIVWAYAIEAIMDFNGRRVFFLVEYSFNFLMNSTWACLEPYYIIDENLTILEPLTGDYERQVAQIDPDKAPRYAPSSAYRQIVELHKHMKLFV